MKVILCENVSSLGEIGATVKVSDGYARNYLIPRKLAVQVDSGSARQIEHQVRQIRRKEEKERAALKEVAKKLDGLTVELKARAGQNEKIFGSITAANIAAKLKEMGHDFDRRQVMLPEPIKSLGIYSVPLRLMTGVEAGIKVWVSAELTEEEIAAAAAAAEAAEAAKAAEAEAAEASSEAPATEE